MEPVKVGNFALTISRSFSLKNLYMFKLCKVLDFSSHGSVFSFRSSHASAVTEPAVIRIPRHMQKQIENVKQVKGKNKIHTVKPGKLLIKSKNPQLNQSAGYTFGKFEQPLLSSKGWKHNKSFGDYFTINSIQGSPPFVIESQLEESGQENDKLVKFSNLNLCKELVESLCNSNITHPTTVQLKTIPVLLKGHNILCAAETGSGKTLSYLLPLVQKIRAENATDYNMEIIPKTRSVVLVPSRELVDQVAVVARTLCAPFDMLIRTVGGGGGVGKIKAAFAKGPPDILVATPGALVKALQRRYLDLSNLSFFVVDEADTMFDPSFADMVESILLQTRVANMPSETRGPNHKAQLVVVGATFPGGVGEVLNQVTDLAGIVTIKSKMLHFLMPHVKQKFFKVKGADKILELHQALKPLDKGAGVLIFCNKATTVNWLGYSLEEMGVSNVRLQGDMPADVRAGIFRSFQKGKGDVLICTDIASRGLDTQRVRMVVNYDFPESHTDYIHRAGRVGRAGSVSEGEVLSFVTHPWDVELTQNIETAARKRTSLPGMESAIHKPSPKLPNDEEEIP